MQLTNVKCIVI